MWGHTYVRRHLDKVSPYLVLAGIYLYPFGCFKYDRCS